MLPFFGYGSCASTMSPLQLPTTSAEPMDRKVKKPLMEKLRRKRINESLDALKDFVLLFDGEQRRNVPRKHLEKADILEKTVECVQQLRMGGSYPQEVQLAYEKGRRDSYEEGFNAATRAVFEYLAVAMPPSTSPVTQQFQLGLITHIRSSKQMRSPWVPPSPPAEENSPPPPTSNQSSPAGKKRPWQPWN